MSFGPFHGLAIRKEYKPHEIDGNWDIPDLNPLSVLCKVAFSQGNQFSKQKRYQQQTNQIWPEDGEGRVVQLTENNSIRIGTWISE